MGKLEKEILDSCGVQPLLWLRFLDDIFMIWDDSEEKLLWFLDQLNKFHETIKFTYNYSKTNAVFLDVNIEKSDKGNLCTSVFEKDTNVHQYIEFSSCHPLSCKKGIPYSQAKRYRRITSDDDIFKQDLNSLETYFHTRNYPADILSEAIQKASNLTVEEALQSNSTKYRITRMLFHLSVLTTHPFQILAKLLTSTGVYLKYRQVKVFAVYLIQNLLLLTRGLQISMTC